MEQARVWRALDAGKPEEVQATAKAMSALNRIHIRRAKLLGLDAPQKLNVNGIYQVGADEQSAERLARRRVLESLPIEEQLRIYDLFEHAQRRADAIERN